MKAHRLAHLRETLARLEGKRLEGKRLEGKPASPAVPESPGEGGPGEGGLAFGVAEVDRCLPAASLDPGAVHEVVARAYGDRPAGLGFSLALMARAMRVRTGPSLIVASRTALRDAGALYGHGAHQLGVDAGRLLLVEARNDKDALWAIEETLRADAGLAMVLGLVGGDVRPVGKAAGGGKHAALADLTRSRRLCLAAAATGTPLVLQLPSSAAETSAAATRWRIGSAASGSAGGLKEAAEAEFRRSRWRIALERCRNGRTGEWCLEWDHGTLRFHLAQELAADAAPAHRRTEKGRLLRFA